MMAILGLIAAAAGAWALTFLYFTRGAGRYCGCNRPTVVNNRTSHCANCGHEFRWV